MKKTIVLFVLIVVCISSGQTYRYSGYLHQSSPEAGLFFSNPGGISPAQAYGVSGMFANPAALGFSSDYGISFCFGTPANPKISCKVRVLDSTERQNTFKIPFQLGFKEAGGINFVSISKKLGPVGIGFGYMQKSATGVGFDFDVDKDTYEITYSFKDTIEASYAGGDTAIPVTWNLTAPLVVNSEGQGHLTLAKQPLFLGIGHTSKPFGIGAGIKLQKYSGNLDGNLFFAGGAAVNGIGIPDAPYRGSINVSGYLPYDTFLLASGIGEFNVNRLSVIVGGLIRTGIFKLGLTLEKAMSVQLDGAFDIYSSIVRSFSDSMITDTDFVHFTLPDSIYGRKVMRFVHQMRDNDTSGFQGPVTLPGYTQLDLGMSLAIFDFYAGLTIPAKKEINSIKAGMLLNIPLPFVSLRAGCLANLDYLFTADEKFIPLRLPVYIGLGGSITTKINFLPIIPDARIDFGIKSNAVPMFSKLIFDQVNTTGDLDMISDFESPTFMSLLSFNLGLSLNL